MPAMSSVLHLASPDRRSAGVAPASARMQGQIPSLVGIRAIAILSVVASHAARAGGAPPLLVRFNHLGNVGVRFFFVLSGFLITRLLLQEFSATGTLSLGRFYLRRSLRILPAFFAYIAILAVLHSLGVIRLLPGDLPHALTFTIDYARQKSWWVDHLWSLSVEEQFYLLWPSILLLLGLRRSFRIAWIVVAAAPVVRALVWYGTSMSLEVRHFIVLQQFQSVADVLAAGCLLAGYSGRFAASPAYLRFQRTAWFFPLALFVILLGNALYLVQPGIFYVAGQSIANIGIVFCLDYWVRRSDALSAKILSWGPIAWIGTISYSLYLWQNPFLNQDVVTRVTSFPINIALAFGMGVLSFYLIEQPVLRLKKKLTDATGKRPKTSGRPIAPAPAPADPNCAVT